MPANDRTIPVLAYHSWRFSSDNYCDNDHVALEEDLLMLDKLGLKVVSLSTALEEVRNPRIDYPLVALTFDDGAIYDVAPAESGGSTRCKGFRAILEAAKRKRHLFRRSQPRLHATSFVIASSDAHRQMNEGLDDAYHWVSPDAWSDDWWSAADQTGLISIGNHSWDHNHPNVTTDLGRPTGNFHCIDNFDSADKEIARAQKHLSEKLGRRTGYFAYPWGHTNDYLCDVYFPENGRALGLEAAFTTEPDYLRHDTDVWRIPRFVCGDHWKSSSELATILRQAK